MIEKTKEPRKPITELLGYIPVKTAFEIAGWIDEEVADQKRNEAIAILQFISSEKSPYGVMFGDQPERFANENREFTSEEIYDLYLQSLQSNTQ